MVKKLLKKVFKSRSKTSKKELALTRKMLVEKVEQGTDRALSEYAEVFKKLAEYDRS